MQNQTKGVSSKKSRMQTGCLKSENGKILIVIRSRNIFLQVQIPPLPFHTHTRFTDYPIASARSDTNNFFWKLSGQDIEWEDVRNLRNLYWEQAVVMEDTEEEWDKAVLFRHIYSSSIVKWYQENIERVDRVRIGG